MEIYRVLSALERLCDCTIAGECLNNRGQIVNQAAILKSGQAAFGEHTLYIGGKSDAAAGAPAEAALNLICFDRGALASELSSRMKTNVIVLSGGVSEESVYESVNQLLASNLELEFCAQEATNALLSDQGLQYLADAASRIAGNPFWVTGMNYNYLTTPDSEAIKDPLILHEIELGHVLDEDVMVLQKRGLREQIAKSAQPYCYDVTHMGVRIMAAPVKIKNVTVAFVHFFEMSRPFRENDSKFLSYLAKLVSVELQKNPYFENNKGIVFSYLLTDLLDNRLNNISNINRRLEALGYAVSNYIRILAVDMQAIEPRNAVIANIAEQLRYMLKGSIYVLYKKHLIFLISAASINAVSAYKHGELERYLSLSNLKAGFSDCFNDILDMPIYYEKSLKAIEIGMKIAPGKSLFHYSDYVVYHVLESCDHHIVLQNLCHGALPSVMAYDRTHKTEFMKTLYLYLEDAKNALQTARKLGIHINTLRYRIEKIKEITGCSLESGSEIMELMLAYKKYRLSERDAFADMRAAD